MARQAIVASPWLRQCDCDSGKPMSAPHRALFLTGGAWAIVAVALANWDTGFKIPKPPLGSLVAWHAYEMVFDFAAVMFAGYALTAMTSWRGKPTLSRLALAVLLSP